VGKIRVPVKIRELPNIEGIEWVWENKV